MKERLNLKHYIKVAPKRYKALKEKIVQFTTPILRNSIKFICEFISRCIAMANIQRLKSFVFLLILGGIWLLIAYFSGIQYLWIKWGIFGQLATVGILVLIPFPEDFPGRSLVSLLIAIEAFLLAVKDISLLIWKQY